MPWGLKVTESATGESAAPGSAQEAIEAELEVIATQVAAWLHALIPVGQQADPRRPQHTRDTITIERTSEGNTARRTIVIGGVANILLEGSTPHDIVPRTPGGALRFEWNGRTWYLRRVHHPGTEGHDYISQALKNYPVDSHLEQLAKNLFRARFPRGIFGDWPT